MGVAGRELEGREEAGDGLWLDVGGLMSPQEGTDRGLWLSVSGKHRLLQFLDPIQGIIFRPLPRGHHRPKRTDSRSVALLGKQKPGVYSGCFERRK